MVAWLLHTAEITRHLLIHKLSLSYLIIEVLAGRTALARLRLRIVSQFSLLCDQILARVLEEMICTQAFKGSNMPSAFLFLLCWLQYRPSVRLLITIGKPCVDCGRVEPDKYGDTLPTLPICISYEWAKNVSPLSSLFGISVTALSFYPN